MKKAAVQNFAIFKGKTQTCNFFKNRTQQKTDVILWILQNLWEQLFRRTSANGCFWFFKTATEHGWVVASVFTLLLSSDNLLTGYEQLSFKQFNQNLSICVSLAKDWFMLHITFNQDLPT